MLSHVKPKVIAGQLLFSQSQSPCHFVSSAEACSGETKHEISVHNTGFKPHFECPPGSDPKCRTCSRRRHGFACATPGNVKLFLKQHFSSVEQCWTCCLCCLKFTLIQQVPGTFQCRASSSFDLLCVPDIRFIKTQIFGFPIKIDLLTAVAHRHQLHSFAVTSSIHQTMLNKENGVPYIPDGVELPGKRVLRLVPKLALLLQLRLLLHQEEVEGSLLLAFASCLLHFRTSSHVSRPLRRRADKRFVRHALCLPYDWDLKSSALKDDEHADAS